MFHKRNENERINALVKFYTKLSDKGRNWISKDAIFEHASNFGFFEGYLHYIFEKLDEYDNLFEDEKLKTNRELRNKFKSYKITSRIKLVFRKCKKIEIKEINLVFFLTICDFETTGNLKETLNFVCKVLSRGPGNKYCRISFELWCDLYEMLAWFSKIKYETVHKVIEYLMPLALGSVSKRSLFHGGNYGLVGPKDYLHDDCPPLEGIQSFSRDKNFELSNSETSFINSIWSNEVEGDLSDDKSKELDGNEKSKCGFASKELAESLSAVLNQCQLEDNYLWTNEQISSGMFKKIMSNGNLLNDFRNEDDKKLIRSSSNNRISAEEKPINSKSKNFKEQVIEYLKAKCDIRFPTLLSNFPQRKKSGTKASPSYDCDRFQLSSEDNQQAVKKVEELLPISTYFNQTSEHYKEEDIEQSFKMASSLINTSSASLSNHSDELLLNFENIKPLSFIKTPDGFSQSKSSSFKHKYIKGFWDGIIENGNIKNFSFYNIHCPSYCNTKILQVDSIDLNISDSKISGKIPITFRFSKNGPLQTYICRIEGKIDKNIAVGTFESDINSKNSQMDFSQEIKDEKYISTYTENQEAPPRYSWMLNQFDKIIQEENEVQNVVSDSQLLLDKKEVNKANTLKVYAPSRYNPEAYMGIKYLTGEWYSDFNGLDLNNIRIRDIRAVKTDLTNADLEVIDIKVKSYLKENVVTGNLYLTFNCKELNNKNFTKNCLIKGVIDGNLAKGTFESEPETFQSVKYNDTMFVRTLSEMNLSPIKCKSSLQDNSIAEEGNEQFSKPLNVIIRKKYDKMQSRDNETSTELKSSRYFFY